MTCGPLIDTADLSSLMCNAFHIFTNADVTVTPWSYLCIYLCFPCGESSKNDRDVSIGSTSSSVGGLTTWNVHFLRRGFPYIFTRIEPKQIQVMDHGMGDVM